MYLDIFLLFSVNEREYEIDMYAYRFMHLDIFVLFFFC